MAQPISSNAELRARLAIMEQKLRSNISNMARSAAMRSTTLTSNAQKRGNSSGSEVPAKVIAEQQPSQQKWEKQQATTETKKYEGLSKPDGKSFKWTAPVSNSGVIGSPSVKRVASITVTSPAILPGAIEKVSNMTMSTQSSTSKLGLTPPIPKKISSLTNDASKFSGLLARIRSVNAEVANSYSEVFSGRSSGSGSTNSSSNSWTTPDASKKLLKTKKSPVSKVARSNIHKWESSSVKRKRKDIPVKRSRTEDVEKSAGKNKKKKRCWNKKEGDFTFIPIATHQYCMFFNKFGSCRSGSSW